MPVISYNVGGVSSMFKDGESGMLIEPHEIEALASAVVELLTDKEKTKSMIQAD